MEKQNVLAERRNVLVCCDGTANEPGENETNVVKLYKLADKNEKQLAFYDPGVGTSGLTSLSGTCIATISDKLGKGYAHATGTGIQKNTADAYRFLMKNYQEGDRLYLFGFSRGAFTARALAGMLSKVGLLKDNLENLIPYAGTLCKTSNGAFTVVRRLVDGLCKEGLPRADRKHLLAYARTLCKTSSNDKIVEEFKENFTREDFSRTCPVHFIGVWDTVESLYMTAGLQFNNNILHPDIKFGYHALAIDEKRWLYPPCLWDEEAPRNGQTIEQVWFPGVHSDVGGWYDERGLSNGALNWMAHRAMTHGLHLDLEKLERDYPANPLDEIHASHKEFPWLFLGRKKRTLPQGAKVHHSAIQRMKDAASGYKPTNLPEDYEEITDD